MITERILKYLDTKGITKYKFCKDLGFSNGFLDKPREISTDKYANILEYFKDVNPEWLLTGNGEMILTTVSNIYLEAEKKKTAKDYIDFYDNFVKVQRIVDILDKDRFSELYKNMSYRCNMIHEYTEHYSLFNKSQELTDETDKKELTKRIQQIINTEKELLKIIAPYNDMILELYDKLSAFDEKHDRAFCLDEETEERIEESLKDI